MQCWNHIRILKVFIIEPKSFWICIFFNIESSQHKDWKDIKRNSWNQVNKKINWDFKSDLTTLCRSYGHIINWFRNFFAIKLNLIKEIRVVKILCHLINWKPQQWCGGQALFQIGFEFTFIIHLRLHLRFLVISSKLLKIQMRLHN